jgi:hypothetical protein
MLPYTSRAELEMNIGWVRNNPELLEPTVKRFLKQFRGMKIGLEQIGEHYILVTANKG